MAIQTMNGKFAIKSVKFPSYALNVYGTSISSGKNVCLYPYLGTDLMQQWIPQAQGNNVYKLSTAQVDTCKLVLDHYRVAPVDNCDIYTSGSSTSNGGRTNDLLDQQVQFDKGSDGYYTIYLYNGGQKNKVLTCAPTVSTGGIGTVTSITATGNVYWAAPSASLGDRQKWNVVKLEATDSDTVLPYAQAYIQRDNTWAYLTTPGEFDRLACGVCALTTCGAIINKSNNITPLSCRNAGGFVYGNVSAQWSVYGISGSYQYLNDAAGAYAKIRTEILAGRPVVVRVNKTSAWPHYVTAYGLKVGTSANNVPASKILIIDPYNPEYTDLQQLLSACSGPDSGFKYIFIKA